MVVTCRCPVVYSAESLPTNMHSSGSSVNYLSQYDPGCKTKNKSIIFVLKKIFQVFLCDIVFKEYDQPGFGCVTNSK